MLELALPSITASEVFQKCVDGLRPGPIADGLSAAAPGINRAEREFLNAAADLDFAAVAKDRCPSTDVSKATMESLYTGQLARRRTRARRLYDDLRASAPLGVCPFCAHRRVTTLDHFMPKAHFPDLAITPSNLLPACSDCNKAKSNVIPASGLAAPLNPYVDRLGGVTWLQAEVVQSMPAALVYTVDDTALDADLCTRIQNHLSAFDLAELYAAEAACDLVGIRGQLERLAALPEGTSKVHTWLSDLAESYGAANANHWRPTAYRAWSGSDWFLGGGFR